MRILSPESALPGSPRHVPALIIYTQAELLTVSADHRLEAAPLAAVTDASFAALVCGVRCGRKVFWELRGSANCVESDSGEPFGRSAIPDEGPKRFVFCLLRAGDRPPPS